MVNELSYENLLGAVDALLELSPRGVNFAEELWPKLDGLLDELMEAVKFDEAHHGHLAGIVAPIKAAAARFHQSLLNLGRKGPLRGDWARFAERDLVRLKDGLLALREFLVGEVDFFKFACLRAMLRKPGKVDPQKLFEELHDERAISERTWVLLMSQPNEWRKLLRDRGVAEELARISSWFLDLKEARRERKCLVSEAMRKRCLRNTAGG